MAYKSQHLYTRRKTFLGRVQFRNVCQEILSPRPEFHQILIKPLSHKEKSKRGVTRWTQLSFIHPIFVINGYKSNFTLSNNKTYLVLEGYCSLEENILQMTFLRRHYTKQVFA